MFGQTFTTHRDVAGEGEFIISQTRQTKYQHDAYIDEPTGTYYFDCDGFVGHVLERTVPEHYFAIPKDATHDRPGAADYFEFFSSIGPAGSHGWCAIHDLTEGQRGDIIAWKSPDGTAQFDMGHVLIVADVPEVFDDGVMSVRVYDSSRILHFDDTRDLGDSDQEAGVGMGTIRFRVDDGGTPVAFRFGPSDRFHSCPISIARIGPCGGRGSDVRPAAEHGD